MNAVRMGRTFVGIILIVAGLAAGVYVGVWWAFIGGIAMIVEAIKANPVDTVDLGLGILRILCAGFLGFVTAVVAVFPGYAMLQGR